MAEEKTKAPAFEAGEAIYDATKLGTPRMVILGLQHMFAIAGLGTLLFHFITKMKVPAFLGSSFAFLGGYAAITGLADENMTQAQLLPYACFGVACAGLVYLILAAVIRAFGTAKVMKYFPPVVTGPIIIAIGLGLAPTAISSCKSNWLVAIAALVVVILFNIWGIGMMRIIPIIMGVIVSYIVAVLCHDVDFTPIKEAAWIGFPIHWDSTVFGGIDYSNSSLILTAVIAIVPIALATMMEHIGDISAISATVGKNYLADPGLHRTLTGDGLATFMASLFGAPANTTYGENTGVLALTRVYDPRVIRIAAGFAALLSFSPKFAAIIQTIPSATVGGISFVLYGMISAAGLRNLVESHVDFSKSRNLIIAAVILVCSLGLKFQLVDGALFDGLSFSIGSLNITLSALAVGSIAGILLNAILPGKDYIFDESDPHDTGADLSFENVALEKQKAYGEKKAKEKAAVKKLKVKASETK